MGKASHFIVYGEWGMRGCRMGIGEWGFRMGKIGKLVYKYILI